MISKGLDLIENVGEDYEGDYGTTKIFPFIEVVNKGEVTIVCYQNSS